MSRVVSHSELQANNTKESIFIAIHDNVYNVTKFVEEHPGGDEVIISEAGKDATEAFEDVGHSDEARALLTGFFVGSLETSGAPAKSKKASSSPVVHDAVRKGSNLMYFVPLALLGCYFAWRSYA